MSDIVAKCLITNTIDIGGILVASPKAGDLLGSNYQINTYSSALPSTGTMFNKYDPRFTGIAPCVNRCKGGEVIGSGVVCVLWV